MVEWTIRITVICILFGALLNILNVGIKELVEHKYKAWKDVFIMCLLICLLLIVAIVLMLVL